jgi:ketosteroid isomerase-like protein
VTLGCSPGAPSFGEAERAAIRDSVAAALAAFQRHSSAGQWDSLAALYSTDAGFRFLESGESRYRTASAIREALNTVPPGTQINTTYRDTEIDPLAPGLASVTTLFETAFADSSGKAMFSFGGALSMVWAHEAGGWRIRSGHSSAPVPRGP